MATLVELTLDPEPSSAGLARRAVKDALQAEGAADDLVDTAMLLVSEVVTNAVLHAGTAVRVRLEAQPLGVRVEVADSSQVTPTARVQVDDHATGRGLFLIETLASEHGLRRVDDGKVIWFVVGEAAATSADGDDGSATGAQTFTVAFVDMHVALTRAALAYGEAVVRELALLSFSEPDGEASWRAPRFNLGPLLDALEAAAAAGHTVVSTEVEFPIEAKELSLERLALVEEGDQLAREGKLLTVPAIPEIGRCRHWVYRQIHHQAEGARPEPWSLPEDASEVDVSLSDSDVATIDAAGAVVAADAHNRIVFVNDAAAALLGRGAPSLVGHRLTALIPPAWRMAHLAGFARYQLTGESRIIGAPVTVPALLPDGTTLEVELLIEPIELAGGQVLRASIRPAVEETG